ncbi:hypothetical protein Q8F55_007172 [Vanrija albida]|uniref:Formamidase n=1 Tax=Vanrija albida TaxID=181172 RepID=A0ABR3PZ49_9TREE
MKNVPPLAYAPSPYEIPTLIRVDPFRPANEQQRIHTRWHPDIPPVCSLELGKAFNVECMDYSGFQINNDDCADDVLDMDHDSDHHLSGPFHVPGAQPGDVLEIDILDVQPHPLQPWGYCITYPGVGALDLPDEKTKVTKTIWEFEGCETTSRHVPHVRFQSRAHPGVIGTAPSAELLAKWTERESKVAAAQRSRHGNTEITLPLVSGAYVGQELDDATRQKIYAEGARTSPGREHGGNIDIGALVRGSKVYLPVYVPGANLSVGDLHFCEADGEPTTAIEMPGVVTLRVNLIRGGIRALGIHTPMYETSPSEVLYRNRLVFTGLSVTPEGEQTDRDGMVSYRNAAFSAMQYLGKMGYSREQAYVLMSAAPIEVKVVAAANQPNYVVSVGLPVDIFEFDIRPRALAEPKPAITGPAVLSTERAAREAASDGAANGAANGNGHANGH